MKNHLYILFAAVFIACGSQEPEKVAIPIQTETEQPVAQEVSQMSFEMVREQYDTLIPLFDGLFITHAELDTGAYRSHLRILLTDTATKSTHGALIASSSFGIRAMPGYLKWGVIDSTGRIIIPFICDGVAAISDHEGIFSIGTQYHHLDTGVPRYYYQGECFHFNNQGRLSLSPERISYNIIFGHNFYDKDHVIRQGISFYLPLRYVKRSVTTLGNHEGLS